ncbi:AAA domain-containing protein [Nocardia niigatensis]|uniref:AAA domain-containing protein n=1 Tax=Nocardia niigatensis TaxID=209249 RepID=UPI0002F32486|nr:AAA domain-containing protein [Nocardia niigatensis]
MVDEIPFPVADLMRAVRAEITADLRGDGGNARTVALRNGCHVESGGGRYEYTFETRVEQSPLNSPQILLRSGMAKEWSRGEAVWEADRKVRVTTATDLGSRIRELTIRDDETAGLEQLIEKLKLVGRNGSLDLEKSGWMMGEGSPVVGQERRPEQFVAGYRTLSLNNFQRHAIEQALGSDATFIWGPPGTGKTEVVGRIIEGCYRQGLTTLFLAPTNVAVDQALERMCELLCREAGFEFGLVQRAGKVGTASLSTRFGDAIITERVVSRLSEALVQQQAAVAKQLEEAHAVLAIHDRAVELVQEQARLRAVLATTPGEKDDAAQQHAKCIAEINRSRRKRDQLGIPSGIFAQRTQSKLDELNRAIAEKEGEAAGWASRIKDLGRDLDRAGTRLDRVTLELRSVERLRVGLVPHAEARATVDELTEQHRQLGEQLSKIEDVVRAACRVLGTTVAKAVQSRKLLDAIDVVVIDEAGMVNLPSAWYVAGLARKRIVVAGDFRQLPAVTQGSGNENAAPADRAHSEKWMDRDVFHAAGLVDSAGSVRQDRRLVRLAEQYRMRPAICALVNRVAYRDAPLTTGRDDRSKVPPSPLLESPLVLVDTSDQRKALGERSIRGGHRTNAVHEGVIHELVRALQSDGVLPAFQGRAEGSPVDRLAVIAPYRDQVTVLQKSISHRFGVGFDGLVDTVHRFQGSQRPVVIIDTVAGASDRAGRFYEGVGPSSQTTRLLNVALSRAQDHLIVVADVEFLERSLPAGSETVQMLAHLREHAHILPVSDLVPVRMASDLVRLSDRELVRPAFFPKDEVQRAVEWDVDRAIRSIEIYCAFLDPDPVDFWLERFRKKLFSGVKVVVHTRDQKGGSKGEKAAIRLRDAGCEVDARPYMHEKVVIIDDEVLWHGSLNLLAGSGPTDLMMRITSRASCARVQKIMARARSELQFSRTTSPAKNAGPIEAAARNRRSAVPVKSSGPQTNRYESSCVDCGERVPAGGGELIRKVGKNWMVRCLSCARSDPHSR